MMAKEDPYIDKAYECLSKLSADEIKRIEYEERQKAIRDYNSQMKSNWRAGHREGVQQGIQVLVVTCREVGVSQEKVVDKVVENFQMSLEEAQEAVKARWDKK